jgi:hypothetical protein
MHGLLIDRKVLINHNIKKLLDISGSVPKTKDDVGVIFLIPDIYLFNLEESSDKLSYINSSEFTNRIKGCYFIFYNKTKKMCEIRDYVDSEHLYSVINSITTYMPKDITIWVGGIPIEKSNHYITHGFDNPHIVDHSPLNHVFKDKGVAFSMGGRNKVSESSVRNKFVNAVRQSGILCNIYARFTPIAISYLRKLNETSEKEMAGSLIVSNVIKNGKKIIFELSPDSKSEKSGQDEEVDAVWSRYNFHTHPKKAYKNHGVVRGWPSSQDYVGFLQLKNHTIFHTVVTLEGIYVISLSPDWKGSIENIDKDYILKNYDIDHKRKISFQKYVEIINKKRYKNVKLFVVKFLDWSNTTKEFIVYYAKTGDKCLATENSFKLYNS